MLLYVYIVLRHNTLLSNIQFPSTNNEHISSNSGACQNTIKSNIVGINDIQVSCNIYTPWEWMFTMIHSEKGNKQFQN